MKLNEFIKYLQLIRTDLLDCDVFIIAENGLKITPQLHLHTKDLGVLDKSKDNVEYLVIEGE